MSAERFDDLFRRWKDNDASAEELAELESIVGGEYQESGVEQLALAQGRDDAADTVIDRFQCFGVVDGEAPEGLGYSGNPRLQAIWTAIRLPTISLPTHSGPNGLPVGIQLIGRYRDDDRLLSVAKWVLEKLGSPTLG